jgi:hypothetical protein
MTGPFLRVAVRLAAVCAVGLGLVLPAGADNSGKPMTFEWGVTYDNIPAIFADGEFTPETPAALRTFLARNINTTRDRVIYFNSLGGDLGAGMEVGKIIRRAELNSGVARNTRDPGQANTIDLDHNSRVYPGHCVSACSLAFLGGVKREVKRGSIFAVHQVSMNCIDKDKALSRYPWVELPNVNYCPELNEALTMMQVANGVVVEYVRSMGVDPIFLAEMSKAEPDAINTLPEDKLREYKIIFEYRTESWEYKTDNQGQLFLQYLQGDQWRQDKVEIYCDRTGAPRLFLWLVHDVARSTGPIDGARIVELANKGLSAAWQLDAQTPDGFADVRHITLQPYEIINPPRLTELGNVALTVDLSPRFLDVMSGATRFQIVTTEPDANSRDGFSLITINLDRDKLSGIVRFCK